MAVVVLTALASAGADAAAANPPDTTPVGVSRTSTPPAGSGIVSLTGRLAVDCAHSSRDARNIAGRLGLCPGEASTGQPSRTIPGNCGTATLTLTPGLDADMTIGYGFHSTRGTIVRRNLSIGYAGSGHSGAFPDDHFMFSSAYDATRKVPVGPGHAAATFGGSVFTFWGLKCDLTKDTVTTTIP